MKYPAELFTDVDVDVDVNADNRKLDSYSYYWTQTGTKRYVHGDFKGGAREGWVRQENWINGPPTDGGWIQRSWSEDASSDNWETGRAHGIATTM